MKHRIAALAGAVVLAGALVPQTAVAEVKAAEAGGFHVAGTVTVARPRDAVWAVLLEPDRWWSPRHRWFDGSTLSLDPRPGGCWCEAGPDGAGAMHMRVGFINPRETLQLVGALGPLQGFGLDGVLVITLTDVDGGTEIGWAYTVNGWQPNGLAFLAGPVDGVLTEQMERLKAAAET
jgi:uncharacterized protein YndB with AHSA1/START domain